MIKRLIEEIYTKRYWCREAWWKNHRSICLDNSRVTRRPSGDIMLYEPGFEPLSIRWILPGTGIDRLGIGVEAKVALGTRVTTEVLLEK